jgi:hypothetical protein
MYAYLEEGECDVTGEDGRRRTTSDADRRGRTATDDVGRGRTTSDEDGCNDVRSCDLEKYI